MTCPECRHLLQNHYDDGCARCDCKLSNTEAGYRRELQDEKPGLAVVSLGIDPGPTPGYFLALWRPGEKKASWARAYQCNADAAPGLLTYILTVHGSLITCGQVEEFRTGRGAGTRGGHASLTREMVTVLAELAAARGVTLAVRHSSQVMPWATDKKLRAAGLYEATVALKDARAASRHCLFAAVHDGGLPDPLSRKHG